MSGMYSLDKWENLCPDSMQLLWISSPKEAFLHYTDMGPLLNNKKFCKETQSAGVQTSPFLDQFEIQEEINKNGRVSQVLEKKHLLLVQIVKSPSQPRPPALVWNHRSGRFIVLTPFNNTIAISKKIGSEERMKKLFKLIRSIRPKNFGVVVRTAENKRSPNSMKKWNILMERWKVCMHDLSKPNLGQMLQWTR